MDVLVERCAVLTCIATTWWRRSAARAMGGGDATADPDVSRDAGRAADLREWLAGLGVTLVGMERTGVYWKKRSSRRSKERFECWLLNRPAYATCRRKTDVKTRNGSASSSSTSGAPELRAAAGDPPATGSHAPAQGADNERIRATSAWRGPAGRRHQATRVARRPTRSPRAAMLEALLAGITEPEQLAELAKARMRSKIPQLREALANACDVAHHGIMAASYSATSNTLEASIQTLDERIELSLQPHARGRAAVHDPRRRGPHRPGPDRRCGLDMTRDSRPSGNLARGPGSAPATRIGRPTTAQDEPAPATLATEALTEAAKTAARRRGPTWPPTTPRSAGAAARPRRPARPATTSSSPTSTSSATRSRSVSSGPTGSASATPSNTVQRQLEALGYQVTVEPVREGEPAV